MQMMATSVKGVVSTGLGPGETLDVGEDTQDIWQEALSRTHPFAGEKKPSMQRRSVDNDYTVRRMYMVTMVTEGQHEGHKKRAPQICSAALL